MRVTISGPIGSGKSSVGKKIAGILGYEFYSGGTFFRQLASEYGMTLEDFNKYAEKHKEIDLKQDDLILDFLRSHDGIVVESRLAGWLCFNNSVESFRIFLDAPFTTRVVRVSGRENSDPELVKRRVREREASELRRYREFYDLDYRQNRFYDLVINTEELSVDQVVNRIHEELRLAGKLQQQ